MSFGWLLRSGLAVVLISAVLVYLSRGLWRRFPLVGIFCLVQVLVVSTDSISVLIGAPRRLQVQMYWTGDLIAHAAISLLIISLIWQTLDADQNRKATVILIGAGVLCFALASAYIFYDPRMTRWMTPLSRNLSFCEEVLNLILWSILLKGRASDYLLLMVSAGIGLQVTGEVIGHTLRLYTGPSTLWVPNTLVYISEIVCLCIWIWAFRAAVNGQVPPIAPPALRNMSQPSAASSD